MTGALGRRHRQQFDAVDAHRAAEDLVAGVTGQRVGQRGLARSVRSHDDVDLARRHGQVETLQDLFARDLDAQSFDGERGRHGSTTSRRPSKLRTS